MKNKMLFVISFFLVVIFYSCDTTEPGKDQHNPSGTQENILWPSLAESPWPMQHRNPQAIGRGNSVDNVGQIKWEFNFTELGEDLVSGLVVDEDSSIYFLTEMNFSAGLYCIDHKGSQKWKVELGNARRFTTPIVTKNNDILIVDYNTLKSFNNKGELNWSYNFSNSLFWIETPQIDKIGNIYLLDNMHNLYKISSVGNLVWQINHSNFKSSTGTFGMAFSPNGKMLYVPGDSVTLSAIDIETASVKWVYGQNKMMTSPIVDSQGNIYCQLNDKIISLTSNGLLRWSVNYNEFAVNDNKPTIDKNGNVFFSTKDSLYSYDFNGNYRWGKLLPKPIDSPLICDENGNIYASFFIDGISMIKYSSTGAIIWEINFNTNGQLYSSPILSFDDNIIFPTEKKVFLIK